MKKWLGSTLVLATAASMLAACGGNNSNSGAASPSESGSAAASPSAKASAPASSVELTLWANTKDESEFDKSLRNEFMALHPNIKLNVIDKSGDTNTEYAIAYAAGVAPDVIDISGPMFKKYIQKGYFAPLDDFIASWPEKDKHTDVFKEIGIKDGTTYGLVTFLGPMMFGYNKALFSQANLQPPKTWDEMIADAVKLTDRSKNQYGYSMLANDWLDWFFQFYVWQAGGDLTTVKDDGTIELQFTSPAVVKALELYKDLKWKDQVVQSDITLDFNGMVQEFATGKSAMMIFAPDWVPMVASLGMKVEDLGIIPMPVGPSGQPVTSTGVALTAITGNISKEKQQAAWEWIAYRYGRDAITKKLQDQEKKGIVPPQIMIYKDMKQSDIVTLDPAWEEALNEGVSTGRDEYEGKAVLTKYVVAAVQKVLVDKNADIKAELQKQQDLAQKEAVDKYNADVLAGK
ncbi:extracellular solute-binding protein [Cohnella sp. 56]|uniref:extracellular solute-binding protein n=1 Tax=Cohnella sp. 56 TaxID=3113722 RepID=UPI0030E7A60D